MSSPPLLTHPPSAVEELLNTVSAPPIFEKLQLLQTRLHHQIYYPNHAEVTPPLHQELLSQINDVFHQQAIVNKLQFQFASANFITNITNFARTRNLESAIAKGQREISSLIKTITSLRDSIDALNQDIVSQKEEAERLEMCLLDTQDVLKKAILQYRKELDTQKSLIESQGVQLEKLALSRIKFDLLMDSW